MARALARDGHDVVLWNRTPERRRALAGELGAHASPTTPREVAADADVAISMVADGAAVDGDLRRPGRPPRRGAPGRRPAST